MMSNKRSKTTHSSRAANAMNVPTATAKKDAKELDLHSTTEEDLKSLQKKDTHSCTTPFQASAKPKCLFKKLTSERSCRQQRKFQGTRECHSSAIHPW
mmetsp:Transcript_22936/g.29444  ORF Transcript_22936/g.29444 Transcript_22936/m.29444 type:complete len:98 (+) Transcript_22936:77-370(+)